MWLCFRTGGLLIERRVKETGGKRDKVNMKINGVNKSRKENVEMCPFFISEIWSP